MRHRPWEPNDEATLQRMAASGAKVAAIAVALGRSVNSVKSRAVQMGLSFQQARLDGVGLGGCKGVCPQGSACCLRGDVPHSLHVCRNQRCHCHSVERYEGERKKGDVQP